MSSIRPREKEGALVLDFRINGVRIREQTRLDDTRLNRMRLTQLLRAIEIEIDLGTFRYANHFPGGTNADRVADALARRVIPGGLPTFAEFSAVWMAENAPAWKRSYRATVECTVRGWLVPRFGAWRLDAVAKADLLAFRAEITNRTPALSVSRKNKILDFARSILREAADRYAFPDPGVSIRALKATRVDIAPFSLAEVFQIIEAAPEGFREYFAVRFFTGMRTAEIDGLKWEYVDFERKLISIRSTIVGGREDTPKTAASARDIDLTQPVLDALQRQRARTGKQGGFVFTSAAGTSLDQHNVRVRIWYPLLDRLGLKRRRPYQTRHTAATLMLAAGENPQWISRQLGHSTTEMLFRVYARYVRNVTRRDGSAFDQLLANQIPREPSELHATGEIAQRQLRDVHYL